MKSIKSGHRGMRSLALVVLGGAVSSGWAGSPDYQVANNPLLDAVCRVRIGGQGMGTGTVFKKRVATRDATGRPTQYWLCVITAGHVTLNQAPANIDIRFGNQPLVGADMTPGGTALFKWDNPVIQFNQTDRWPLDLSVLGVMVNANAFFAGTFAGVVTNGESNTAIGSFALTNNNTGGRNTSVGSQSMQANIDGGHNTALGNQALAANTSGGFNTALGELALRNNLTGLNNTAVGRDALKNSVGHNNIALGSGSGENLTTGDDNIALGNAGVAGESGRIRIGTDGTHTDTYLAGTIHGDGSGLSGINGANLAAGSITSAQIAEGAVGGTQLAPGAVQGANLASGAAAANLSASGLAGVPTGGIVLSQTENPALAGAGYVKIGSLPAEDTWELRADVGSPPARRSHSAVWTGSEMIVWGGDNGSGIFSNGARFDPAGNGWTPLSLFGTPDGRLLHTAVWTGTEMIVWGGSNNAILNTGGRYNPVSNTWLPVSTHNAPGVRNNHTAVWTGSEMIVWGGDDGTALFNSGSRYHAAADTWTAMQSIPEFALARRRGHTAVWTGSEMLVWGGLDNSSFVLGNGGRYNPASNTWAATGINTFGAPSARYQHTAVWTGVGMIIWGGSNFSDPQSSGAHYHPPTDSWFSLTPSGAPGPRSQHKAFWTGSEMIIWGGHHFNLGHLNDGGRYNPANNSWRPVNTTGAPPGRSGSSAVWTGSEMIIWGGYNSGHFNDGARYKPQFDVWTATGTSGTPIGRQKHSAVWTGDKMLIWGGINNSFYLNGVSTYTPGKPLFLYQKP